MKEEREESKVNPKMKVVGISIENKKLLRVTKLWGLI